jgi:uncharacterized protein (DUF427 family)
VETYGKTPIHAEHPAMKVQSNGVVITEANSPVVSISEGRKTNALLQFNSIQFNFPNMLQ